MFPVFQDFKKLKSIKTVIIGRESFLCSSTSFNINHLPTGMKHHLLCAISHQDVALSNIFVALSSVFRFPIPLTHHSVSHLHNHIREVVYFFSLSLLPSICPASIKFYKPTFHIICSRNLNQLSS